MMYHIIYFPDNGHFFPCKKIFFSREAAVAYEPEFWRDLQEEFGNAVIITGKNPAFYVMEYGVVFPGDQLEQSSSDHFIENIILTHNQ